MIWPWDQSVRKNIMLVQEDKTKHGTEYCLITPSHRPTPTVFSHVTKRNSFLATMYNVHYYCYKIFSWSNVIQNFSKIKK